MISSFSFTPFPEIFFGEGEFLKLPEKIQSSSVLIVTGGSSIEKSGALGQFLSKLEEKNISFIREKIAGEPSPAEIDAIAEKCRSAKVDTVIGAGGGSVLDAGKAIAAMAPLQDGIKNYLEGVGNKTHPGDTLPFVAVPTTAGTGSEATKNAVISQIGEKGFKKSLRHNNFIPEIAVIDPVLMVSCPASLTAACGLDNITQLLESYVSTKANPVTDALALGALEKAIPAFPVAVTNGEDLQARAAMAYGALVSGITLANAGLGVVHGFASTIGGFFDIPHGVVCGTLLPAATEINIRELKMKGDDAHKQRLNKHIQVARFFEGAQNLSDNQALDSMISQLYRWVEDFKIPGFGHYGIKESDIGRLVENSGQKNNPVELSEDHMKEMLRKRL